MAATRFLTEAARAVQRHDERIIWGAGIHPGLTRSHTGFDPDTFTQLIDRTPPGQRDRARRQEPCHNGPPTGHTPPGPRRSRPHPAPRTPRNASIHSYAACEQVLDELERAPAPGMVLHWWLGDLALTTRAVSLGCYFSLNASAVRKTALLEAIPLDRVLTETDHPFGDHSSGRPLPGNVAPVEQALARHHPTTPENIRQIVWRNLAKLVRDTRCAAQPTRPVSPRFTSAAMSPTRAASRDGFLPGSLTPGAASPA
ncbi:TatD family hydrolase [Streptomyces qaidamensis]|uniref:TatD family hydrolase n=1 Tax=Streptomyces qaidamensis TaxID=1783515 RepID=UPI0036E77259